MKNLILILILINLSFNLYAQDNIMDYKRSKNETANKYVNRIIPKNSKLVYDVFETNVWDLKVKSIIAFYIDISKETDVPEIYGHIYMKQNDVDYYRDISLGPIEGESQEPEILDVFFTNIDSDSEKEIVILYKYWVIHYDCTGYIYDTKIFDNPSIYSDCLDYIAKFENIFISFDCISQDGKSYKPEYTNAESVKKKLYTLKF